MPDNLIEVWVCVNMAGVSRGDVIMVDADDPHMQELLDAVPPLLLRTGEESGQ